MGQKKSSEPVWLIRHLLIQWFMFATCLSPFLGLYSMLFATANAIVHGIIDWNIWRLYKYTVYYRLYGIVRDSGATKDQMAEQILEKSKGWKYWEDHLFYTTIGLDQMLHMLTLVYIFATFL